MALQMLTTIDLFYILMWVLTHKKKLIEIAFDRWPVTYDFTLHFENPRPHYMILKVSWDGLWTLSIGLLQFQGHGSRLVRGVALSDVLQGPTSP